MRLFIPNPDNIKRAAAERPERLVRMLPSASSEVREEIFEALAAAGNLEAAFAHGPAQKDAIDHAAATAPEVLVSYARHADIGVVEQIILSLLEFSEPEAALTVAMADGKRFWVVADDSGNELEYEDRPYFLRSDAAQEYVDGGNWGDAEKIEVRVWPRFKVGAAVVDYKSDDRYFDIATGYEDDEEEEEEDDDDADEDDEDMPSREYLHCKSLQGPIAIVYQPKLKQLMGVMSAGAKSVDVFFGHEHRAHGYFDSKTMGDCARTHSAGSGVTVGTGDGMALYTGLATLAYQGCERECIGSCPASDKYGSRTKAGDDWWDRASKRGLARDAGGGCQYITLKTLINAGLVFWMLEAGDYAGAIASAQEKYAAAFAAAEPDPNVLDIIGEELEQLLASEDFEAWRAAHNSDAAEATPNRRGGRRGKRKPAFVTPELEAHVESLYEGLEGL